MYGVPQRASSPSVWFTQMLPPCCHVAHSRPVESMSMTSDCVFAPLMTTGNPWSIVYWRVAGS